MLNAEIEQAVNTIYKRTGLIIPDIFVLEETDYMKKKWTVNGVYNPLSRTIYLRPALFIANNDISYFTNLLNRWNKDFGAAEATPEQVKHFMQETEKQRLHNNQVTIVHECGHHIHNIFYYNKGLNIPYEDVEKGTHAHKNSKENFATAFASYVLELIPKESKRYKRMDAIVKECYQKSKSMQI